MGLEELKKALEEEDILHKTYSISLDMNADELKVINGLVSNIIDDNAYSAESACFKVEKDYESGELILYRRLGTIKHKDS